MLKIQHISPEKKSGYKSIFKSITLFGGVQVWKIFIEIIRQKIIATILGPFGIGISELLTSATTLIQSISSFGLSTSAIKSIAEANASGDIYRISKVVIVLRRLMYFTGLLGMIIVIGLSPFLSKSTFGNYDFTFSFIFLSVTLLFQQLTVGQSVLLQGMKQFRSLAKASVYGSFFGLIINIPIYYFIGIKGIVPSLILSSITALILTWIYSHKIVIIKQRISPVDTVKEGAEMLKIGFAMSLTNVLVLVSSYILKIYIARLGGTEEVGFFSAGFAIVNGYVGLVFTAMGTDYYPRLAEINNNRAKYTELINQQAEIAILLLSPIIMIFLMLSPTIIILMYSSDFLPIVGFMQWTMIGMIFRPASWTISYLFIAKGDMKSFLSTDLSIKFINLPLFLIFYKYFGLTGLGIAFMINNLIYMLLVFFVSRRKYEFKLSHSFYKIFYFYLILIILYMAVNFYLEINFKNILLTVLLVVSILYSLSSLDRRLYFFSYIKSFINEKRK
ncbi:MAG TPA: oligosaccharide flippase family protein [Bacteroidales bacterium]|nr:oligosaccharide flippase family protein [Bacteroidales bacterium]